MEQPDRWGNDPQVRATRRVFAAMEKAQTAYLERLGLSPWEPGLRRWRPMALESFERAWPRLQRQGALADEEGAGDLYVYCLARVLIKERVPGAEDKLPPQDELFILAEEALA